MLAGGVEQLGRDDAAIYPETLAEAPAEGVEDVGGAAERTSQRLRRFLQIGEIVALRLDLVAHPGFGRD